MRKTFMGTIAGLAAMVVICAVAPAAKAQGTQSQAVIDAWKFNPKNVATGDGGPAPKHDLNGTWAGPGSSPAVPRGAGGEKPSLTPAGQQLMALVKPIGKFGPAGTNNPNARYCDPVGFPQNLYTEGRGLTIASLPDRVLVLVQFMDMWREIWTDGRPLPTKVGGYDHDSLDPTYNGYSVGHWEDDTNFVVDTTGIDEKTWLTGQGLPHSVMAHVQEHYTRTDHNSMKIAVTVDDPKMYTKPFSLGTNNYKWLTNQKIDEWLCIPSDVVKYLTEQGDPAGSYPDTPENEQRVGRERP